MRDADFEPLEYKGDYFVSKVNGDYDESEGNKVGTIRVGFTYNKCSDGSIMAQQIKDDEDNYTLRKWNPEKRNVPYGVSTDGDMDSTCGNPLCCYICMCVNCIMNVMFEETINKAQDGRMSSDEYFEGQGDVLNKSAKSIRPTGIILCIVGHYLLFSPVIKLLDMIPFVGWLLSGIVVVAAAIFSFIVGLTLSILTIAIAWIVFRPLYGILLLAVVGTSVYLVFFHDWKGDKSSGEDTTAAVTTETKTTNPVNPTPTPNPTPQKNPVRAM